MNLTANNRQVIPYLRGLYYIMDQQSHQLFIQPSTLPGAGMGLFTKTEIPRGTLIIEYLGTVSTWKEIMHDVDNPYLCYVNRNHVINGAPHPEFLARYANDAAGPIRIEGMRNNSFFEIDGTRVFIKSTKRIPAGSEIFVNYGKEYWETATNNAAMEETL